MLAGISPLRYNLAEAAQDLAISVQSTQARAINAKAGKLDPNATPIGWFSNRKRISPQSGIRVTRFHVWQNLSGSAEGDVAPLHATIMFELSNEWYSSLSRPNGIIRIENVESEEIIEAELMIHQASYGLESTQPTLKRVQFVMSPTPLRAKLDTNESVHGIARMKFWNRRVTIKLPETKVLFVR